MAKKEYKIGIVDDHVHSAESLSLMLEHNLFNTFQAYNGKEAIEKANAEKPDLLLVDIRLNGVSGYEVAKALPDTKILFVTGYDVEPSKVAKHKNAIGIMQKPVDINELLKKIRTALKIPAKKKD